ncbi:VCBS repeat-containing protein [Saccharothrix sp. NPDC042600]|uniref:FG-GAP repeat domain-containing protein n=2 Tax=Saccharothrix TaxID=2071 RepID=UPI003405BDDA
MKRGKSMTNTGRWLIATALTASMLAGAIQPSAHADTALPCSPNGVTSADNALAALLNGRLDGALRGGVSGYQISCARVVVKTTQRRGLGLRAAAIAVTTAIVESRIQNLDYGDADSEGLFQQRPSMGWGTPEQVRDPVYATNKFLDYMVTNVPDWRTRSVGEVCQAVQRSAFPERYGYEAHDGAVVAQALFGGAAGYSGDFDGNGLTDFTVYRPTTGNWRILYNDGSTYTRPWGGSQGDQPVSGDFDGNGLADFTIYRPSTGNWHILHNDGSTYTRPWGGPGQLAVSGDYDGNGLTDFTTYTPHDGNWHILYNNGTQYHRQWGGNGHTPVAGDYDGNGLADFVTYTPHDGYWHILHNDGTQYHRQWGSPGDIPVAGDYNGNGLADFAVYRPTTQTIHILHNDGTTYTRQWGSPGDIPA